MRKVIQLVVEQDTPHAQGSFIALCDDGTIWDRQISHNPTTFETTHVWVQLETPPAVNL